MRLAESRPANLQKWRGTHDKLRARLLIALRRQHLQSSASPAKTDCCHATSAGSQRASVLAIAREALVRRSTDAIPNGNVTFRLSNSDMVTYWMSQGGSRRWTRRLSGLSRNCQNTGRCDPADVAWQAIRFWPREQKIGNVFAAQGESRRRARSYIVRSLAISERLAGRDSANLHLAVLAFG